MTHPQPYRNILYLVQTSIETDGCTDVDIGHAVDRFFVGNVQFCGGHRGRRSKPRAPETSQVCDKGKDVDPDLTEETISTKSLSAENATYRIPEKALLRSPAKITASVTCIVGSTTRMSNGFRNASQKSDFCIERTLIA